MVKKKMKKSNDVLADNQVFVYVAAGTVLILLIPLVAMQITSKVLWTLGDFVVAFLLIFGTASIFVFAARKWHKQRLIIGIVLAALFFYIWIELAVGLFTNLGS